jgi:hypothetical protein
MSQAKLGALADVHPANISAIEKKQRPCWPALRRRISMVLGVGELFDEKGWALDAIPNENIEVKPNDKIS